MEIKKKIYISLPITSRKEQTIRERVEAAFKRCELLKRRIAVVDAFKGWEIVTPFDVAPIGTTKTEAEIMGGCVQAVLESDAILLDRDYTESKGARLEAEAAALYGKQVYIVSANSFNIRDLSNGYIL